MSDMLDQVQINIWQFNYSEDKYNPIYKNPDTSRLVFETVCVLASALTGTLGL